jgi:hypothetical protein
VLLEELGTRRLVVGAHHFEVEVCEHGVQQLGQLRLVGIVRFGDPELKLGFQSCRCRLNLLFSLRKLPCDCEVRGHGMSKEMPIIQVNRVLNKKKNY